MQADPSAYAIDLFKNTDDAWIGMFDVTLTVSIKVPTNNDWSEFETISQTASFTLLVRPCLITSFSSSKDIADLSYRLGDLSLIDVRSFVFVQVDQCDYSVTYELLSDLPEGLFTVNELS